jgi:MFS family permease
MPIFWRYMTERGLLFSEIMLLSAIYSAVVTLVEVPTGAFADRIGRKQSMMFGSLALVASGVTAYFAHSFMVFAIAETLAAISMALCSGADSAYLYDLLKANGRTSEYARLEGKASAWHLGGMAAAMALGGALGEIDLALPYLATAGVGAAAFVITLVMRDERVAERAQTGEGTSMREELGAYMSHMGQALRDLRASKALIWVISYSTVVFVLLKATVYLYQPYLDERGFGIANTGLVFAGVFVVAAAVAQSSDSLRALLGERALVWGLLIILAGSFMLLNSIVGHWALALLALQAVAKGLYSPLTKPLLNRGIVASGRRATLLSIESIARRLGMGAFSPVAGYYGAASAIYLCGAIGIAGLVGLAAFARFAPLMAGKPRLPAADAPASIGLESPD